MQKTKIRNWVWLLALVIIILLLLFLVGLFILLGQSNKLIFGGLICIILVIIVFRKKIYLKKKEFILLFVIIISFLSIIEIGSRIYLCNFYGDNSSKVLIPNQCGFKPIYEPHHYLNHRGTPNYISLDKLNIHNSLGFRGPEIITPKPEGIYRIVIIGGSSTYTVGVKSWKEDFPRQLEKELQINFNSNNIEVINAGLGGWNSWESMINFELNVLDLEPDLIIIYHGVNDVHVRLVNPKNYKGDNSGFRKSWGISVPFYYHSTFIRLITGLNPFNLDNFVNVNIPAFTITNEETGFSKQLNGTPMETLQKNKPIYFERNLKNIIAIANEYNISVLLSTWAHSNQSYVVLPYYQFGLKQNNEVIRKIGKTHNIPVYDFILDMPIDPQYWVDGAHVNEKGAELKGKLFADYIYNNDMLKEEIEKLI